MKKVLFVYHYIALYREPVFEKLLNLQDCSFLLLAILNPIIQLKCLLFIYSLREIFACKKYMVRFLFSDWLLRTILNGKFSNIIFLGDPHFVTTWFALLFCKLIRVKTSLWTHGFLWQPFYAPTSIIKLLFYSLADQLLLYGNMAKNRLISLGCPPSKLRVIYNSLDYPKISKLRREIAPSLSQSVRKNIFSEKISSDLPIGFFIGRLEVSKKLFLILDSLHLLKARGVYVHFLFIGDGHQRKLLESLVDQLELSDLVRFSGEVYDENVIASLVSACDFCVSPGIVGLTAMHSMMYGKPVVTHSNFRSQMPEYEAVVPGKTGELFDEGSSQSLAQAISRIIDKSPGSYSDECIKLMKSCYSPEAQAKSIIFNLP